MVMGQTDGDGRYLCDGIHRMWVVVGISRQITGSVVGVSDNMR